MSFSANEALLLGFIAANVGLSLKQSNLTNSLSSHAFNSGLEIHKNLDFNLGKKLMRLENDKRLQKLMDFAYNQLDAERVSIFTYSPQNKSLVCAVSQDIKGFSIPHDKGFAGLSFTAKRVINIPDTERDERHNKDVDHRSGFTTRSVLCAPIISPEGTALGVIQAVNKRSAPSFTYVDEEQINEVCSMMIALLKDKADQSPERKALSSDPASTSALPTPSITVTLARSVGNMILAPSLEELVTEVEHAIHVNTDFDFVRVMASDGDRLFRIYSHKTPENNHSGEQFKLSEISIQLKQALQFSSIVEYQYNSTEDLNLIPGVKLRHAYVMPATHKAYPLHPGDCLLVVGSTSSSYVGDSVGSTREILDMIFEYFSAAISSISERHEQEDTMRHLKQQHCLLNNALSAIEDYVLILDQEGKLLECNKCLDDLLGHTIPESEEDSPKEKSANPSNKVIHLGMYYTQFLSDGHSPDLCRDIMNALGRGESRNMQAARLTSTVYPDGINVDYHVTSVRNPETVQCISPFSEENKNSNPDENEGLVVVVIHVNTRKMMDIEHAVPTSRKARNILDLGSVTNGVDAASQIVGAIRTNFILEPEVEEQLKEIMNSLAFTSRRMSLTQASFSAITLAVQSAQTVLVNPSIPLPNNIFEWEFNSLVIKDTLVLCNIMGKFFETLFDLDEMGIDSTTLARYIAEVGRHYHDRPFHNLQHATCVTHFTFMLIRASEAPKYLKPHLVFAILLSAVVHDVDHPGNTNLFEINSQSDLAIRYNDQSVLENHHCSTAFRLMRKPNLQVLSRLGKPLAVEIRKYIISCVMATDMAVHFELIDETKKRAAEGWNFDEVKDQNLLGKILLHAADLSNPVRPFHMTREWAQRISLEFNDQVKRELALGMPVLGFMMTPDEKAFCKNEMGFASFVVAPMWRAIASVYTNLHFLVEQIDDNLGTWKKRLEELQEEENNARENQAQEKG